MKTALKKIKLRISQLIGLGPKIHREFFAAVKNNDLDKVNQFLDAGFNPNCIEEARTAIGYIYSQDSPLTIAAHNGLTVQNIILNITGEINIQDSPLAIAAYNDMAARIDSEAMVLSLLKAGADVAHKGTCGSAFEVTSDVNIAKALLDAGADIDEVFESRQGGLTRCKLENAVGGDWRDIEMVRMLIERGAYARLDWAGSWAGNLEAAKLLADYLGDD